MSCKRFSSCGEYHDKVIKVWSIPEVDVCAHLDTGFEAARADAMLDD